MATSDTATPDIVDVETAEVVEPKGKSSKKVGGWWNELDSKIKILVLFVVGMLCSFAFNGTNIALTSKLTNAEAHNAIVSAEAELAVAELKAKTAEVNARAANAVNAVKSAAQKQAALSRKIFACDTIEKSETGFAARNFEVVNASNPAVMISNGCASMKVEEPIAKLSGSGFWIKILDSEKPGYSWVCGDFNGRNDSLGKCKNMLNEQLGAVVEVITVTTGKLDFFLTE